MSPIISQARAKCNNIYSKKSTNFLKALSPIFDCNHLYPKIHIFCSYGYHKNNKTPFLSLFTLCVDEQKKQGLKAIFYTLFKCRTQNAECRTGFASLHYAHNDKYNKMPQHFALHHLHLLCIYNSFLVSGALAE